MNALLHRIVAEEAERLADHDDRLRLLTVTDVVCDADLRHAVVYLASLSEEASVALEEHRRAMQSAVGEQLSMKRTPQLRFLADPAVAAGERIEQALRRAREQHPNQDSE